MTASLSPWGHVTSVQPGLWKQVGQMGSSKLLKARALRLMACSGNGNDLCYLGQCTLSFGPGFTSISSDPSRRGADKSCNMSRSGLSRVLTCA